MSDAAMSVGHDVVGQAKTELPVSKDFDPIGSAEKQQSEPIGEFGKRVEIEQRASSVRPDKP